MKYHQFVETGEMLLITDYISIFNPNLWTSQSYYILKVIRGIGVKTSIDVILAESQNHIKNDLDYFSLVSKGIQLSISSIYEVRIL